MYDLVTKIYLILATENAIEFLEKTGTNIADNAPVDIQLLFKQIEFLQSSIRQFTTNITIVVGVLGLIFTVIAFVANYLSKENIKDNLKITEQKAEQEFKDKTEEIQKEIISRISKHVEEKVLEIEKKTDKEFKDKTKKIQKKTISRISKYADEKVLEIKKIIAQESTISQAKGYYINADNNNPLEFKMLRERGFERIEFRSEIKNQEFDKKIIILDLINLNNKDKAHSDKMVDDIEQGFPKNSILIIYVPSPSDRIKKLLGDKNIEYVTIANNRITLVGAVVDSAYILDTILSRLGIRDSEDLRLRSPN